MALHGAIIANKNDFVDEILKYGNFRRYTLEIPAHVLKLQMK